MRLPLHSIVVSAIAFVGALLEGLLLAADFIQDQTKAPDINLAVVWLRKKHFGGLVAWRADASERHFYSGLTSGAGFELPSVGVY